MSSVVVAWPGTSMKSPIWPRCDGIRRAVTAAGNPQASRSDPDWSDLWQFAYYEPQEKLGKQHVLVSLSLHSQKSEVDI